MAAVKEVIKKIAIPHAKAVLGGSGAKGTWLKRTHDIDIYVIFQRAAYKSRVEEMSSLLQRELKKKFRNVQRVHGSRDYFHLTHKRYLFEIIPILSITSPKQAHNITDFSQLHVAYVLKQVKRKRKLADDIRLAKQFALANGAYGAESYIRGFSGYVMELLTIHYGSFMNLIKAAATWKGRAIIGKKEKVKNLNASKVGCLIVVDPVQPERNAAAAVSSEKYYDFIMAARTFLHCPSPHFFRKSAIDVKKLENVGEMVQVMVTPLTGKRDVVGAQLLKAFTFIKNQLRHHDFTLVDARWSFFPEKREAMFYYVLNRRDLPLHKKHFGPSPEKKEALRNFKKKHGKVTILEGKSYVLKKRAYTNIVPLLNDLLVSPEVTSRVKDASFLCD